MKHLLNKTLTVKQVIALIILPLGILASIFVFTTGGDSKTGTPLTKKDSVDSTKKTIAVKDTSALGRLLAYVDSLNNSPELQGGSWSYYLAGADSGKAICKVDIDRGLIPASVMKVVTTGTALELLGSGYHFTTLLQYDGTIDAATKTLNGNIYIHGGGDPSLGSESFGSSIKKVTEEWVNAIKNLGIDSVAGCIIGDAESFERDPVPGGWAWSDMQCDYGVGPCGLNINENCFNLLMKASGGHVSMRTDPVIPGMKLYCQVVQNTSIAKPYAFVDGAPFQFDRTALGEIRDTLSQRSAIPDPALFCAQNLKQSLSQNGIGVRDSATTLRLIRLNYLKLDAKDGRKNILTLASPSLSQLAYHTMQISANFYAESFLRAIALHENGYGSTTAGVNIVYSFWRQHGLDLRGMCMVDGSGVSRFNTLTTHQLVEMLRVYSKDSSVFNTFYHALPVAGESGTIRKLADGTLADGNVHAKSGTMSRVRAYAGYVTTRSGKLLCFAMIGNNTLWSENELRDKFERLFILMAELP